MLFLSILTDKCGICQEKELIKMGLFEVPEREFVDPQTVECEPKVVMRCGCHGDIYEGEKYWIINGDVYCQGCIKEHIDDYLKQFERVAG